jgi:hypothetical protein
MKGIVELFTLAGNSTYHWLSQHRKASILVGNNILGSGWYTVSTVTKTTPAIDFLKKIQASRIFKTTHNDFCCDREIKQYIKNFQIYVRYRQLLCLTNKNPWNEFPNSYVFRRIVPHIGMVWEDLTYVS